MAQKDIALELLVRSGNPKGVEKLADTEKLDGELKKQKIAEAGIYSALKVMWEEAEGGIDSQRICPFLNQPRYGDYFNSTRNVELLEKMVDVLQAGTHAQMEAYAQITAIDVLAVDSFAGAVRRNIDAPHMKEKVTKLIQRGYSLVFCPHDIDAEMVDHYFPIIDKWRDFVNPREVAQEAVSDFAGMEDLFEYDYQKDFVYRALDKLIQLTDRGTVSRLMQEKFEGLNYYQRFIDDGKIDAIAPIERPKDSTDTVLNKALQKYEQDRFPSSWNVEDLAKVISDTDKKHIAQRMGQWFRKGKMRHFSELAKYKNGILYDPEVAKKAVGEAIAEASLQEDLSRLEYVLNLPQNLIDETNPAISGVVTAYRISQQTKKTE